MAEPQMAEPHHDSQQQAQSLNPSARQSSVHPVSLLDVRTQLDKSLERARLALLWEALWPVLATAGAVIGLYLLASWLGLWPLLPPWGRIAGLVLLMLLLAAALWPLRHLHVPERSIALARLDRDSALPHRPASSLDDRLTAGSGDRVAAALWSAHIRDLARRAADLRPNLPSPGLAKRDPYALRYLLLLALVPAGIAAGAQRWTSLSTAFQWQGLTHAQDFRIDGWISAPAYTGRAPILLPSIRSGEVPPAAASFTAPQGATLVLRFAGLNGYQPSITGALEPQPVDASANNAAQPNTRELHLALKGDGSVTLPGLGSNVRWSFTVQPDQPPAIAFSREPRQSGRGGLELAYKLEDDYGVTSAEAKLVRKPEPRHPALPPDPAEARARPLVEAPKFELSLPQQRTRQGIGHTTRDLSTHPWAGSRVAITLIARDDAGQQGVSDIRDITLPRRPFRDPLARALLEQRLALADNANAHPKVLTALEAFMLEPDLFKTPTGTYLGLRTIYRSLVRARSDDDLRTVVDQLWDLALAIEDGTLTDAAKALEAAKEALRQALERGADDPEIKRLTQELRQAMQQYLEQMMQQAMRNPRDQTPLDPNTRMLRPQDLSKLLDRIEDLARSGARDAARQMLEQLQAMLDNLRMARPGQSGQQRDSNLDKLGNMIQRQQKLRDRTFREGQQQRQNGRQGQPRDGSQIGELKGGQEGLRQQLQQLMEQLRQQQQGGQQGGKGNEAGDALDEAADAMRRAEDSLGQGDAEGAVGQQGKALDALRRGGRALAQQQRGPGEGTGEPGDGPDQASDDSDPLGRPMRNRGFDDGLTTRVPGEAETRRAQRILEELRKRLGEAERPRLELDYIERLLREF